MNVDSMIWYSGATLVLSLHLWICHLQYDFMYFLYIFPRKQSDLVQNQDRFLPELTFTGEDDGCCCSEASAESKANVSQHQILF